MVWKEQDLLLEKILVLKMMPAKNAEELRSIAKGHAEEKMDVVVATGNVETVVAGGLGNTHNFRASGRALLSGFVKSLARPRSVSAGVSYLGDY